MGGGGSREDGRLEPRLARFIEAVQPGIRGVRVHGLRRSDVGYSRENWVFDAEWVEGGERRHAALIMRRDPTGSVLTTDRGVEYALLKALEATSIPAPRARWLDRDGSWFERPSLIMDRVEGECRMFAIEGPDPVEERLRLGGDCVALLGAVHAVDWRRTGVGEALAGPRPPGAASEVAYWEKEMRAQQLEGDDRLDELVAWLHANAPTPQAEVLVHGDFKPGNMLLREGRIAALLDWETAHIGDPVEDVGWITNPLRRREHQIRGLWETPRIVERYEEITGFKVTADDLRYWNAFANFKLAVIVITGIRAFVEGRSDRPFDPPVALVELAFQLIEAG